MSCDTNIEDKHKSKVLSREFDDRFTLKPDEILAIDIDSLTNLVSTYMLYYQDVSTQQSLLAYLNNSKNQIQFYDLTTRKLSSSIDFDQKTGINQLKGFYIKNLDSIMVVSAEKNMFFLTNEKGESIKKYIAEPWGIYLLSYITNYAKVGMLENDKFVYHKLPYHPPNQGGFWSFPVTFSKSLNTEDIDTLYQYDGYRSQDIFCGGYLPFSCEQNDKQEFIYSFFMDEYVYSTDFKNKPRTFYAGSKYFDEIPSMNNIRNNEKLQDRQFNTNYAYKQIIFDKFRKVYYRFVLHPTQRDNMDYMHGKPFSIVILDENLKKVGETEVFKEKMYYTNYFVAPEGLYISLNHSQNPEIDEDKLKFRLFKLIMNE